MELPKGRHRIRIGRLPYTTANPYVLHRLEDDRDTYEIITAPPRQLAHLAREDEIDAACIPASDVRSLNRRFEPLATLGIVTTADSKSMCLATRLEAELLGQARIGLSDQAAGAGQLAQLVLHHRYKVKQPRIIPALPDMADLGGYVAIGDEAQRLRDRPLPGFPRQYWLDAEWHAWTGMPFVLGRWLVRKTVSDAVKQQLVQVLTDEAADAASPHFRFHLDDTAMESMQQFTALWREYSRPVRSWRDLLQ